jgi:hypothetical protein
VVSSIPHTLPTWGLASAFGRLTFFAFRITSSIGNLLLLAESCSGTSFLRFRERRVDSHISVVVYLQPPQTALLLPDVVLEDSRELPHPENPNWTH